MYFAEGLLFSRDYYIAIFLLLFVISVCTVNVVTMIVCTVSVEIFPWLLHIRLLCAYSFKISETICTNNTLGKSYDKHVTKTPTPFLLQNYMLCTRHNYFYSCFKSKTWCLLYCRKLKWGFFFRWMVLFLL